MPAVAQSEFAFLAALLNWRFPYSSALKALTRAKSPVMAFSNKYSFPSNTFTSFYSVNIPAGFPSLLSLIGNPPFSIKVPNPVGV